LAREPSLHTFSMDSHFLTQLDCVPRGRQTGFTLVELLITVLVLSLLLTLAVPAFESYVKNDEQWVQQNTLVLSLNGARSEAIKQDTSGGIQVCASSDGATCAGASWAQGWIVLNSANGKVVQAVGALPAGTTLTEANGNLSITYLSNGAINSAILANPAAAPAFTMCDTRGAKQARFTQVSLMGRVVSAPTVGQDLNNNALVCP
jgi:type IV fimbrial biogenesis protein FimT